MDEVEYRGEILEPWYHVSITNVETKSMFYNMFRGWFKESSANYSQFVKAILNGSVKEMNIFMNDVAMSTFGKKPAGEVLSWFCARADFRTA